MTVDVGDAIFTVVEIEVGSRCNRSCHYCPVSLDPRPPVPVRMPDRVFHRIADELQRLDFRGRVSYHFYNEPLLRHDLEQLVTALSTAAPRALQVLYTNGDYLTDKRHRDLVDAGIDAFIVTSHDDRPFPDRALQWFQTGSSLELTNRAGRMVDLPKATARTWRMPCFAPSEMLIVTVTGDVVLCYEDSARVEKMGNVLDHGLDDIWRAPLFTEYRHRLAIGDRLDSSSLCRNCSNMAHTVPGTTLLDEPFGVDHKPSPDMVQLKKAADDFRNIGIRIPPR